MQASPSFGIASGQTPCPPEPALAPLPALPLPVLVPPEPPAPWVDSLVASSPQAASTTRAERRKDVLRSMALIKHSRCQAVSPKNRMLSRGVCQPVVPGPRADQGAASLARKKFQLFELGVTWPSNFMVAM